MQSKDNEISQEDFGKIVKKKHGDQFYGDVVNPLLQKYNGNVTEGILVYQGTRLKQSRFEYSGGLCQAFSAQWLENINLDTLSNFKETLKEYLPEKTRTLQSNFNSLADQLKSVEKNLKITDQKLTSFANKLQQLQLKWKNKLDSYDEDIDETLTEMVSLDIQKELAYFFQRKEQPVTSETLDKFLKEELESYVKSKVSKENVQPSDTIKRTIEFYILKIQTDLSNTKKTSFDPNKDLNNIQERIQVLETTLLNAISQRKKIIDIINSNALPLEKISEDCKRQMEGFAKSADVISKERDAVENLQQNGDIISITKNLKECYKESIDEIFNKIQSVGSVQILLDAEDGPSHVVSFFQKNKTFRMFDANSGEFIFNNLEDMKKFASDYFQAAGYDKKYQKCRMISYSPLEQPKLNPNIAASSQSILVEPLSLEKKNPHSPSDRKDLDLSKLLEQSKKEESRKPNVPYDSISYRAHPSHQDSIVHFSPPKKIDNSENIIISPQPAVVSPSKKQPEKSSSGPRSFH